MGKLTDVTMRDPKELNSNRKGPLGDILAVVDRDIQGNEIILQLRTPGVECPSLHYLLCTDRYAFDDFMKVFKVIKNSSRRNLRLVKMRIIEDVTE
jgi:hypothetical protein